MAGHEKLLNNAVKPRVFAPWFQRDNVFLAVNIVLVVRAQWLLIIKIVFDAVVISRGWFAKCCQSLGRFEQFSYLGILARLC
jgi:hypothetical protein